MIRQIHQHAPPIKDVVEQGHERDEGDEVGRDVGHQRDGHHHALYGRVEHVGLRAVIIIITGNNNNTFIKTEE